jgi:hypothetical protein
LAVEGLARIVRAMKDETPPQTVQEVWARAIARSDARAALMTDAEKEAIMDRNVRQMRISRGLDKKPRPKLEV